MKTNKIIVFMSVCVGLLAAALTLLVNAPASWEGTFFSFHFRLAANSLTFILHIGAAALFLLSLNVYREKLKRAFVRIVAGIVLIAVGMLQLPILDAFDKWSSMYVNSGFIGLPYLLGGLLVYLGVARFAWLLNSKSVFKHKLIVLPTIILLVGLSSFLPHAELVGISDLSHDSLVGILSWTMFLLLAASVLFLVIRKNIGQHYKSAMLWSGIAALLDVVSLTVAIADTMLSPNAQSPLTQLLNVLTIVAGFAWLRAGYLFRATKEF